MGVARRVKSVGSPAERLEFEVQTLCADFNPAAVIDTVERPHAALHDKTPDAQERMF